MAATTALVRLVKKKPTLGPSLFGHRALLDQVRRERAETLIAGEQLAALGARRGWPKVR